MRAGGSATVEAARGRGMSSARARGFSGASWESAAVGYLGSQEGDSGTAPQRSCLEGGAATGGFHYGRVRGWCGLSVLPMSMPSLWEGALLPFRCQFPAVV